jgi:hypothetical protein
VAAFSPVIAGCTPWATPPLAMAMAAVLACGPKAVA